MKRIKIGTLFLVISGLNVYLPEVGNMLDQWRIAFSLVAFMAGWLILMGGILSLDE